MGRSSRRQEEKIWYVYLDGAQQGPFAVSALGGVVGFSPDSFVWREGLADWVPAGTLPELAPLFKDQDTPDDEWYDDEDDDEEEKSGARRLPDGGTAVIKMEPNQFIFWFVIILLIITYMLYRQGA